MRHILNLFNRAIISCVHATLRKSTLAFIVPGVVLSVIGLYLGDNGVVPIFVGTTIVFLGYVHRWRKPLPFAILAGVSLVSFPVGVLLHNVFYGLGELSINVFILHWFFEFLHVIFFLLAIPISPTGLIVGIIGLIVTFIFHRYQLNKFNLKGKQ